VDVNISLANISLIITFDKTIDSCLTTYYAFLVFFLLNVGIMSGGDNIARQTKSRQVELLR